MCPINKEIIIKSKDPRVNCVNMQCFTVPWTLPGKLMRDVKTTVVQHTLSLCAFRIWLDRCGNRSFSKEGSGIGKNILNVETDYGRVHTQLNVLNKHSWSTVLSFLLVFFLFLICIINTLFYFQKFKRGGSAISL